MARHPSLASRNNLCIFKSVQFFVKRWFPIDLSGSCFGASSLTFVCVRYGLTIRFCKYSNVETLPVIRDRFAISSSSSLGRFHTWVWQAPAVLVSTPNCSSTLCRLCLTCSSWRCCGVSMSWDFSSSVCGVGSFFWLSSSLESTMIWTCVCKKSTMGSERMMRAVVRVKRAHKTNETVGVVLVIVPLSPSLENVKASEMFDVRNVVPSVQCMTNHFERKVMFFIWNVQNHSPNGLQELKVFKHSESVWRPILAAKELFDGKRSARTAVVLSLFVGGVERAAIALRRTVPAMWTTAKT